MAPLSITRSRLERLVDERERTIEKLEDGLSALESEQRDPEEFETAQFAKYREKIQNLDDEVTVLAADIERENKSRDISELLRVPDVVHDRDGGPVIYRTFAAYARDELIARFPQLAGMTPDPQMARDQAEDRLKRAVQHTLTSDVAGLLPPAHMNQILDIINGSRPVVASGRNVNLDRGELTYPQITGRPTVVKQTTEKTEGGTAKMSVTMGRLLAETYLGGGNLSWQTINWSSPDALQLWFDLAAEAYARQTETAACSELGTAGGGTISTPLGTAGTESFAQWRAAILAGIASIYNTTAGRANTNTLYLSAARFFALAGLGSDQTLQISSVGNLNIESMTGTYSGLRVVGSYGFSNANTAIVGDSQALLVGETPNAPVEMRAVEPAIGGMEVGVIGAFKAKVFDAQRFVHLS